MFLVDTSVFINYLRGRETNATRYLDGAIDQGFCITPIIYQEVLQGANNPQEYDTLRNYLGSQFFCYPTDPVETFEKAAKIYFDCRRKGITIRSTVDCLIAQIAIDNLMPLLHDDTDFNKLTKVCGLELIL